MVWGTALLFLDCIFIILLYERLRAWLGDRLFVRLALAGAAVLSFDQVMFFFGLARAHRAPACGAGRRLGRQDGRGVAL